MAKTSADTVNTVHQGGYDATGAAPGGPFFSYDPTNPAGSLVVAVTDNDQIAASGLPRRRRRRPVADALADLTDTESSYQRLVNDLGPVIASVRRLQTNQTMVTAQVDGSREQLAGVNLDEEMRLHGRVPTWLRSGSAGADDRRLDARHTDQPDRADSLMTINRVTQSMMMGRSFEALQTGLGRLSKVQEQLSTGRIINRPSDSPTDATAAMRIRASLADQTQYTRNVEDGIGWLGQIDNTLTSALGQIRRARDLGLQGANATSMGSQAREALAVEVDQIRDSLIDASNASYLRAAGLRRCGRRQEGVRRLRQLRRRRRRRRPHGGEGRQGLGQRQRPGRVRPRRARACSTT